MDNMAPFSEGLGFVFGVTGAIIILLAWLPVGIFGIYKLFANPTWTWDIILLVWFIISFVFMVWVFKE